MRRLEMRKVRARNLAKLTLVGARALLENHKSMRRFAPAFMREPDDRNLLHGRVSQKDAFDFNRRNVFPAAYDDVFQAVADFDVTVGMHDCCVTRMKPSPAKPAR